MSRRETSGNPNRLRTRYLVNILFLCGITLTVLMAAVFLMLQLHRAGEELNHLNARIEAVQGEKDKLYTAEEVETERAAAEKAGRTAEHSAMLQRIQSSLESGESTLTMLRGLFPDDLVVKNGDKYYFFSVLNNVPMSAFTRNDFQKDASGRMQYAGSDTSVRTRQGVDVSEGSGVIDWKAVAEDGIDFAFICAGGRDAEGRLQKDGRLAVNLREAAEAGLETGGYFRLNAISLEEVQEDAAWLLNLLAPYKEQMTGPVAVVVSMPGEKDRRVSLSREMLTELAQSFSSAVSAADYDTLLFAGVTAYTMKLDLTALTDETLWVSDHGETLYFPYRFRYWQYTDSGQVNGIEGKAHLDLWVSEPDR